MSKVNMHFRSCVYLILLLFAVNVHPVYAATASDVLDKANATAPLDVLYSFMRMISIPVSACGLAMCAFSFFIPNEKGYEIAKKRILHIGLAILALFILPAVSKFATGGVASKAWNGADSTRIQIIENKSDKVDLINGGPGEDDG